MRSLQTEWQHRVERDPGASAVAFVDSRGRTAGHTRAELYDAARGRARALAAHGIAPGDVCVLALPSDATCAVLLLGILLAGGVPLLVPPPAMRSRFDSVREILAHATATSRARIVIVPRELRDDAGAALGDRAGPRVLTPDDVGPEAGGAPLPSGPPRDAVAAMQLTSGTTGLPRICVWDHSRVLAAIEAMTAAMGLRAGDRVCCWVPLYHDMGLVNNFLLCLLQGVPLALLSPTAFIRRPALWLRTLSDFGATHSWAPNFGFAVAAGRVRDDELADVRLDHVRALWNAAERIHPTTMRAFHGRFGKLGLRWSAMKTNYGCAENVGGATFSDPSGPPVIDWVDGAALSSADGVARPVDPESAGGVAVVSVGRPTPGSSIDIVAADGSALPDGRVGEIALHSPSRMRGYLQADGSVSHAEGPIRTGDLGYRRAGEIFWTGRLRETIVVRGRKLDPSDFERVLLTTEGLRPGCFAVFGIDDPARGTQRLVIVAEADASTGSEIADSVRARVELDLGVQVDEVVTVDKGTLTKTSSGKRRHLHFRDLYLRGELR